MRTRSTLIDLASLKVAIHKRILLFPGTEIFKVRKEILGIMDNIHFRRKIIHLHTRVEPRIFNTE